MVQIAKYFQTGKISRAYVKAVLSQTKAKVIQVGNGASINILFIIPIIITIQGHMFEI